MLNAPQEDPVEISVGLIDGDVAAGITEMEQISPRSPIVQFYLSLHVKYASSVGLIILPTKPDDDMQNNQLNLHIPIEHMPIEDHGGALNGTLQDFSISLEEKQQTAENIYEVLSATIYRNKVQLKKN